MPKGIVKPGTNWDRHNKRQQAEKLKRAKRFDKLVQAGWTLQEIADKEQVSRQAIWKVLQAVK